MKAEKLSVISTELTFYFLTQSREFIRHQP